MVDARAGRPLFVLAIALLGIACEDGRATREGESRAEAPASAPDLILITVDTLRADHTSLYGYSRETTPYLDEFFAEGRIYERAYATSSYTTPSIFSVMTGLWPFHHGLRRFLHVAPEALETLAMRLTAAGYTCGAFVSNHVLKDEHTGLARGFAHYDDILSEKESVRDTYERTAAPTTEAASTWLKERRKEDRPYFLWVHYIDPHGPYVPPEPKVREFSHDVPEPMKRDAIPEYQRHPGVDDALEYVDLYDEEIAHVDHSIGELLRDVPQLERGRPWLTIFSSDHGEALLERRKRFMHSHHVYEELIRVPLALRGSGIEPARVTEPVSIVDIAPTMLAAAGLAIPAGLDGIPLVEAPARRTLYAEAYPVPRQRSWTLWRTAIHGEEKWVLAPQAFGTPHRYRSGAGEDGLERLTEIPIEPTAPQAVAVLAHWHEEDRALRLRASRLGPEGEPRASAPSDADRAALEALGYVE